MHTRTHTSTHMNTHTHIHTYTHIRTCTCTCTQIHTCTHNCTLTHPHTRTPTHTRTHTHTHTHTPTHTHPTTYIPPHPLQDLCHYHYTPRHSMPLGKESRVYSGVWVVPRRLGLGSREWKGELAKECKVVKSKSLTL